MGDSAPPEFLVIILSITSYPTPQEPHKGLVPAHPLTTITLTAGKVRELKRLRPQQLHGCRLVFLPHSQEVLSLIPGRDVGPFSAEYLRLRINLVQSVK